MNHPVEEAASQAVQHVSKIPTIVAIFGNGVAFLAEHDKELQAISLSLTILWILWQWGRSLMQDARDLSEHRKLLAKLGGMKTQPAELTPEERHATSPTPLFDDTYAPDQAHHEGKQQ